MQIANYSLLKVSVLLLFLFPSLESALALQQNDFTDDNWNWVNSSPGVGNTSAPVDVFDALVLESKIYTVGNINIAGGYEAFGLAIYDDETRQWSATPDGPAGLVVAIANHDNRLFLGGLFTMVAGEEADYMTIWNLETETWETFNEGIDDNVRVIYIVGDDMFVGGEFSAVGEMKAGGIARYNLTTGEWDDMGGGLSGLQSRPYGIRSEGDLLYVLGSFSEAGGIDSPNIAVYNMQTNEWSSLGTETSGTIHAIAFGKDYIYFGGAANIAPDGSLIRKLFRYNRADESFSGIGAAFTSAEPTVQSLLLMDDYLYVGGNRWDEVEGDESIRNVARIHLPTEEWEALAGMDNRNAAFYGILDFNGDAVFHGRVNYVNNVISGRLLRWVTSENRITYLGDGLNHGQRRPKALIRSGDQIFLGGELFRSSGDIPANRFAAFNPGSRSWIQTHSGWLEPNGGVEALIEHRGVIYVGGNFRRSSQYNGNNLAAYDPVNHEWSKIIPENQSLGGTVLGFAADDDDVYLAGGFSSLGGTQLNNITRYHVPTGTFHPVGDGTDGRINAILIHEGYIYVGGRFEQAGGEPAVRLARFDLQNQVWESVSTVGPNEEVLALHVYNDYLYVGGRFTNLASGSGQFVARKSLSGDGDWESIGTRLEWGVGFSVLAINDFDGAIHIGGRFDGTINGTELNNIARLSADETEWVPLGSGVNDRVNDMLVWETDLWVIGNFGLAGGKPAAGFTVWSTDLDFMPPVNIETEHRDLPQSVELDQNYPNPFNPVTTIHYTLPEHGHVQLEVYNVTGQRVATLVNVSQSQGTHTAVFDGSGLSSGVYMYRITVNGQALTRKMLLVK